MQRKERYACNARPHQMPLLSRHGLLLMLIDASDTWGFIAALLGRSPATSSSIILQSRLVSLFSHAAKSMWNAF